MVILLTATIDPNNCASTIRTSITDRTQDYYNVITELLTKTDLEIVFIENSNHSLGILSEFIGNQRIEILQFEGNTYNRSFGKSFGEQLEINYALVHSEKLKSVDYIMKLTGRYSIDYDLIKDTLSRDYVFYAKKRFHNTNWLFCGFFKIPKLTWITELSQNIMITDMGETFYKKLHDFKINYLLNIGLNGISGARGNDINIGLDIVNKPKILRGGHFSEGLKDLINYIATDSPMNMVEVGCYSGESSEIFLKSGKISHINCVDPWDDEMIASYLKNYTPMCIVESVFDSRLKMYEDQFTKYKLTSIDASGLFEDESFDFVYLDGNHEYESIKADIELWLPKIKSGGWLGGHDYYHTFPGVIKAVNEKFGKNIKIFADTSWIYQNNPA